MSQYTLIVRIPQAGNKEISYSIQLTKLHESYPEDYFRQENHRFLISQTIEQKSARTLASDNLNMIISSWITDIKVGRHHTLVTLDLPVDTAIPVQPVIPINNSVNNVENSTINNQNNQNNQNNHVNIPVNHPIVAPAKKPIRPVVTPNSEVKSEVKPSTIPDHNSVNKPENTPTEKTPEPVPDIRTDTNKADF